MLGNLAAKSARRLRAASQFMSGKAPSRNPIFPAAPSPLQEFSVVYSDRALNHMSKPFVKCMQDLSRVLGGVHNAEKVIVIPGSGSSAMESVARQFAANKKVLTLRNGWFSYRWTQVPPLVAITPFVARSSHATFSSLRSLRRAKSTHQKEFCEPSQ